MSLAGRSALTAGIVIAAATCTLAACSSSTSSPASTPAPTTSASAPTSDATTPPPTTSAPATTSPASSTPASTTAAPTTSAAPSTTRPASSTTPPPAPAFTTTCRSLRVDVLKGGAIRGMEIAAMQFTNTGNAPCTVTGTPTATLLRNGARVGPTSRPNGDRVTPFTLQPGEYGEALLRDFSTCNAPLSDHLRLTGPSRNGATGSTITQPLKLRACRLRVAPVGEPS